MTSHTLLVKNMVCHRCVLTVEDILTKAVIPFYTVVFGEIHLINEPSKEQIEILSAKLRSVGFELIDNHMSGLIEKIKMHVIKKAHNEVDEKEKKSTSPLIFQTNCTMSTHISAVPFLK
jgi:AraC family transcriptional regulator